MATTPTPQELEKAAADKKRTEDEAAALAAAAGVAPLIPPAAEAKKELTFDLDDGKDTDLRAIIMQLYRTHLEGKKPLKE